jgi:hypothetical protein
MLSLLSVAFFIVSLSVVIFIVVGLSIVEPGACNIKLFAVVIYGFYNKLECLSLASPSSLVQCLWIRPEPTRRKHLQGSPL